MTEQPEMPLFTTRQTAHALGMSVERLRTMVDRGIITPRFQAPGARGTWFFHADDIRALLANADQRKRVYRARRAPSKYPMNGLQPVRKRPYRGRGSGL